MICKNCEKENTQGRKYCFYCGEPLIEERVEIEKESEPAGKPINRPVSEPINRPAGKPINRPASEPIRRRDQYPPQPVVNAHRLVTDYPSKPAGNGGKKALNAAVLASLTITALSIGAAALVLVIALISLF